MPNYTEAQLALDFIRCWRCGALDRKDWLMARLGCRECGSRRVTEAVTISEAEGQKVASGWFEQEANQ